MSSIASIGHPAPMRQPIMPKQNIAPQTAKPAKSPKIQDSPKSPSLGGQVDIKA